MIALLLSIALALSKEISVMVIDTGVSLKATKILDRVIFMINGLRNIRGMRSEFSDN